MQDAGDFKIGAPAPPSAPVSQAKSSGSSGPAFGVPPKLEPFSLLAKSTRGPGCAQLVMRAIAAPGVFVFGELLEVQSIKELEGHSEYGPTYALLDIFAYGTYSDYKHQRASGNLPELNHAQETKLKQLTILSLANTNRVIPYSVLLEALSLPSVPVLEDLLIEAIYQGLLGARLDQREAQVEVTNSLGRDVRPSPVATPTATSATAAGDDGMELDASPAAVAASSNSAASSGQTVAHLGSALHAWLGTIHALLDSLSQHLAKVQADAVNERLVLGHQEDEVKRVLTEVTKESAGAGAKGKGKAREDDEGATGGVARGLAAMAGRMLGGGGKGKGSGVGKDDRAVGGVGEEEMEVDGEGGKGGAGAGRKGAARDAKRRRG